MDLELLKLLKTIKNKFFHTILCQNDLDELLRDYGDLESLQELILSNTVGHKLNVNYPVKFSFQKQFLKYVISELEYKGIEVDDGLYSFYLNLLSKNDSFFYLHYTIDDDTTITIKTKNSIISDGTTGLSVWQAGKALAEYSVKHKNDFERKSILELGSGLGVTGISVILTCAPQQYFFSDNHNAVLDYLCNNIFISLSNVDAIKETPTTDNDHLLLNCRYLKTDVFVLNLPWETENMSYLPTMKPDIILAADVIFDDSLFGPISNVLKLFWNLNNNLEIIFACTIRNWNTYKSFNDHLAGNGFSIKELITPRSEIFDFDPSVVKIISIVYREFDAISKNGKT